MSRKKKRQRKEKYAGTWKYRDEKGELPTKEKGGAGMYMSDYEHYGSGGWSNSGSWGKVKNEFDDVKVTFHPAAWLKLQYLCHKAETEVCCFGIANDPAKPLYIDNLLVPKQESSPGYCDPDMEDFSTRSLELLKELPDGHSYNPASTALWIHTHPQGFPAQPSGLDEQTFKERGGDWAIMFILSKRGDFSCKLKVKTPLGYYVRNIPTAVDWEKFPAMWRGPVVDAWNEDLTRVEKKSFVHHGSASVASDHRSIGFHNDKYIPLNSYVPKSRWDDDHTPASYKRRGGGPSHIPFGELPGPKEADRDWPDEYKDAWDEYIAAHYGKQQSNVNAEDEEETLIAAGMTEFSDEELNALEAELDRQAAEEKQTPEEAAAQDKAHAEMEMRAKGD